MIKKQMNTKEPQEHDDKGVLQLLKKFHAFLQIPRVHFDVHISRLIVPTVAQMNPLHILPSFYFRIHLILSTQLRFYLPDGLFLTGFPTKPMYYAFHMS